MGVEEGLLLLRALPVAAPPADQQGLEVLQLHLGVASEPLQDAAVVCHVRELLADHHGAALRVHGHEQPQPLQRGLCQRLRVPCVVRLLRQPGDDVLEDVLAQPRVLQAAVQGPVVLRARLVDPGGQLQEALLHSLVHQLVPLLPGQRLLRRERADEQLLGLLRRVAAEGRRRLGLGWGLGRGAGGRDLAGGQEVLRDLHQALRGQVHAGPRHGPRDEPQDLRLRALRQGQAIGLCLALSGHHRGLDGPEEAAQGHGLVHGAQHAEAAAAERERRALHCTACRR
mmetsp:Transcript_105902/g.341632  ORF Transcript_105902/g.341632 Transcript_105902/m.341632 type:complete len:284 (+) Transcript_105902:888-1739(+)